MMCPWRSTLASLLLLAFPSCADEPRHRLIVLGFDGATWDVIDPMLQRGELKSFQALIERGCRGPLRSIHPMKSPVVWTSIATGKFAREHNILDFMVPYGDGPKMLVRSHYRRAPAIWNVASHEGRSVCVLGYYATYPVENVLGVMVAGMSSFRRPGGVYPPDRQEALVRAVADLWKPKALDQITDELVGWDYDAKLASSPEHPHHQAAAIIQKGIAEEYREDECFHRLLPTLLAERPDLLMAYFRTTDTVGHTTWIFHDSSDFEKRPDPGNVALLGGLVQASYRYVDRILGEVMAQAPDANIVVVSDHGMGSATGKWPAANKAITGNHRPHGIFLAAGPDVRHGTVDGVTVMDVMPLMLALLDLPHARDLPGKLPVAALRESFTATHPRRWVESYDIAWETLPAPGDDGSDAETRGLDVLKGLGYVAGSQRSGTGESHDAPRDFWQIDRELRFHALLGELQYDIMQHNGTGLAKLRELIQQRDPELMVRLELALQTLQETAH
jgi:predicted AlkP superfamily phosphohydrolase/phosphomutase